MQHQINHILNRPFPLFLNSRKGRCYFIWLIFFVIVVANMVQPLGFINSCEFHKSLLLKCYIFLFFFAYALQYLILSYFRPNYYNPETWSVKKELGALMIFIPVTALITYLYACCEIPEYKPGLQSFVQLQYYNMLMSLVSIPTFGYFVDTRLNPYTKDLRRKRKEYNEAHPNLSEQKAQHLLQKLHHVMETEQLYLSDKCNLDSVAKKLDISVHHLSYAINTYSDYNFNDFVNKYRVEHACLILQNGHNQKLKLEVVGMECGFGGKGSFYTAFRKFTGKRPSEYLEELKKEGKKEDGKG